MSATISFEDALARIGTGTFQRRLLLVFGLVWAADAMQVLSVGFAAPSIAAEFGLNVPQALQVGTAFFAGMLVGASAFGRLADRIGRRRVLLLTIAIDAVFGLASAFAPDFAWLLAFRFLTGLGVGGTLPVDYALMAEFLPPRGRGRWLVMLEGFWAVGTIALALAALAAPRLSDGPAWRTLFLLTALPALVGLAARLFVPESPLYLLRQGRERDARAVLERLARINRYQDELPAIAPAPPTAAGGSILGPNLRRRTLLILLVWLLVSMSYYGVFVWLPVQLAAQGFGFLRGELFLLLVALAQLPGYALAAYGVERWGRRPTLAGFLVLSAAGCVLYGLDPSPALVAGSTLLMSFALLGTWGALYAWTPELYPTQLRATGMGAAGAVARLGGLAAPSLLAPLAAQSFAGALALYAAFLVAAAVATVSLRAETRGAALG
ncbi:MFS transporter [Aureimonas jatrophae]|uniref:MFS transporter, putative metabolite:H+ symporter n=1 Tax=Aureimonas jatrophae TaxID=1166073 RepID=A0A1H0K4Z9_9HYPH|nr:MFS transporter [Aureimonas jatrophae]MBB3950948.1 putative MFS transporter [Aureimonas jatrophae]SDO50946.1 MFS transporter, putative metabolite:H+ symporter [Aureimonas jatrophae]